MREYIALQPAASRAQAIAAGASRLGTAIDTARRGTVPIDRARAEASALKAHVDQILVDLAAAEAAA